ncbi:putative membrane protein [Vibrio paracholerae 87395]|nr:putative membrane protein [Vibrio paracholerae 87395]
MLISCEAAVLLAATSLSVVLILSRLLNSNGYRTPSTYR